MNYHFHLCRAKQEAAARLAEAWAAHEAAKAAHEAALAMFEKTQEEYYDATDAMGKCQDTVEAYSAFMQQASKQYKAEQAAAAEQAEAAERALVEMAARTAAQAQVSINDSPTVPYHLKECKTQAQKDAWFAHNNQSCSGHVIEQAAAHVPPVEELMTRQDMVQLQNRVMPPPLPHCAACACDLCAASSNSNGKRPMTADEDKGGSSSKDAKRRTTEDRRTAERGGPVVGAKRRKEPEAEPEAPEPVEETNTAHEETITAHEDPSGHLYTRVKQINDNRLAKGLAVLTENEELRLTTLGCVRMDGAQSTTVSQTCPHEACCNLASEYTYDVPTLTKLLKNGRTTGRQSVNKYEVGTVVYYSTMGVVKERQCNEPFAEDQPPRMFKPANKHANGGLGREEDTERTHWYVGIIQSRSLVASEAKQGWACWVYCIVDTHGFENWVKGTSGKHSGYVYPIVQPGYACEFDHDGHYNEQNGHLYLNKFFDKDDALAKYAANQVTYKEAEPIKYIQARIRANCPRPQLDDNGGEEHVDIISLDNSDGEQAGGTSDNEGGEENEAGEDDGEDDVLQAQAAWEEQNAQA